MTVTIEEEPPLLRLPSLPGDPTWEIATIYPLQGQWTESSYLALDTNKLVELVDGCLDFLTPPTLLHQWILQSLLLKLDAHVKRLGSGLVLMAPLPVRLWPERMCEPDVVYFTPKRIRSLREPPDGADLMMEVVNDGQDSRLRDFVTKRSDYAKAQVPEYWIVDPLEQRITVLSLEGEAYRIHGEFGLGDKATSVLLDGFTIDISALFEDVDERVANLNFSNSH